MGGKGKPTKGSSGHWWDGAADWEDYGSQFTSLATVKGKDKGKDKGKGKGKASGKGMGVWGDWDVDGYDYGYGGFGGKGKGKNKDKGKGKSKASGNGMGVLGDWDADGYDYGYGGFGGKGKNKDKGEGKGKASGKGTGVWGDWDVDGYDFGYGGFGGKGKGKNKDKGKGKGKASGKGTGVWGDWDADGYDYGYGGFGGKGKNKDKGKDNVKGKRKGKGKGMEKGIGKGKPRQPRMPDPPVNTGGEWVLREDFQGVKSFGFFYCGCGRSWLSAHTNKNYRQGCQGCEAESHAYYMWQNDENVSPPARDQDSDDQDPPHDMDRCEACRLGVCLRQVPVRLGSY